MAAGALAIAVAGADVAPADRPFSGSKGDQDAAAFWTDVSPVTRNGGVEKADRLAHVLCMTLGNGVPEADLIATGTDGDAVKVPEMTFIVHAAELPETR